MIFCTPNMLDELLEEMWKERKGEYNFHGSKIVYDLTLDMTKEEWKRQWKQNFMGERADLQAFYTDDNGRILMPRCGIL